VLRRVHGGAVPAASLMLLEPKGGERDLAHADEKDRIARKAVDLLPADRGSLLLDAGTTTARLAMMIPRDLRVTVITNAVPIASRLAGSPSVSLHLLPGRVRPTTHAAVGEDTVAALGLLRPDVAFVGTNGLSRLHGLSTPDPAEAAVKRAMVACARQVVVLVDSSKIGREHMVRFAALDEVDVVITDSGIDDREVTGLESAGVEVLVA
jgi:DeoR family transcriptional regulator, fructose operon transcriptional repressor